MATTFLGSSGAKVLAGAAAVGAVGIGVIAFTASNTVATSNAGQGSSITSGFTVSDISYTAAPTGPTDTDPNITQVTFDIARVGSGVAVATANATVYVQLLDSSGGTAWTTCTSAAGVATCNVSSNTLALSDVTGINVAAYDVTS